MTRVCRLLVALLALAGCARETLSIGVVPTGPGVLPAYPDAHAPADLGGCSWR